MMGALMAGLAEERKMEVEILVEGPSEAICARKTPIKETKHRV